jgi:hypothetical protein
MASVNATEPAVAAGASTSRPSKDLEKGQSAIAHNEIGSDPQGTSGSEQPEWRLQVIDVSFDGKEVTVVTDIHEKDNIRQKFDALPDLRGHCARIYDIITVHHDIPQEIRGKIRQYGEHLERVRLEAEDDPEHFNPEIGDLDWQWDGNTSNSVHYSSIRSHTVPLLNRGIINLLKLMLSPSLESSPLDEYIHFFPIGSDQLVGMAFANHFPIL